MGGGGGGWDDLSCCNSWLGHMSSRSLSVSIAFVSEEVHSVGDWDPFFCDSFFH